jgi:hypothetical protein
VRQTTCARDENLPNGAIYVKGVGSDDITAQFRI